MGISGEKLEKVAKSWKKWLKVVKSGDKWGKVGKSDEKLEKVAKSWNKWRKIGISGETWGKVGKSGTFFCKMAAPAILDDQKSLSITFLAISDQYATFIFLNFFSKMDAGRHFGSPF